MATNICIPFYEPGGRLTAKTTAAVTGKRVVGVSANREAGPALNDSTAGGNIRVAHAGAGAAALGVAEYDAASGALVGVICTPGAVVPVTCAANITAGQEVEVGAAGQVVPFGTGIKVGYAVSGAASGADAQIRLY